jgi:phospholipid N-methyltransferase
MNSSIQRSEDASPSMQSATLRFLESVLRDPRATGAIAPSSKRLARKLVEASRVSEARDILELGPGTGVVTREILETMKPDARILAIEHSREFVSDLSSRYPDASVVHGCASELKKHSQKHGFTAADSIISGLPWTIFPTAMQAAILRDSRDLLRPGGVFVTIACFGPHLLPSGKAFRQILDATFSQVVRGSVLLRNVPPAFVYACSR